MFPSVNVTFPIEFCGDTGSVAPIPPPIIVTRTLSHTATTGIITAAQKLGLTDVKGEYTTDYRDCTRVVFECEDLSKQLWRELKDKFPSTSLSRIKPSGVETSGLPCSGTWIPCKVNEVVRVVRYIPGQYFKPHTDGGHVVHDDCRSIFTVLVFLNEGYTGGDTKIYTGNYDYPEVTFSGDRRGTVVAFPHAMWHEGCTVTSGEKFVLRTDIMFVRIEHGIPRELGNVKIYNQIEKLYKLSNIAKQQGFAEDACSYYLDAMRLSMKESTGMPMIYRECGLKLQPCSYFSISEFVDIGSLIRLSEVCAEFNTIFRGNDIWKPKYIRDFETPSSDDVDECCPDSRWWVHYRHRYIIEHREPILFIDLGSPGSEVVTFRYSTVGCSQEIPSCVMLYPGHKWCSGEGSDNWEVGNDALKSVYFAEDGKWLWRDGQLDYDVLRTILRWIFAKGNRYGVHPRAHKLVFSTPGYSSQTPEAEEFLRELALSPENVYIDERFYQRPTFTIWGIVYAEFVDSDALRPTSDIITELYKIYGNPLKRVAKISSF